MKGFIEVKGGEYNRLLSVGDILSVRHLNDLKAGGTAAIIEDHPNAKCVIEHEDGYTVAYNTYEEIKTKLQEAQ